MHAVVFEARPRDDQWDPYLAQAGLLRPELERIDGFLENRRFRSLRRPGWLVSLSTWRDEAALIAWRRHALHREAQRRGRAEIFQDYRLRVGEFARAGEPGGLAILDFPLPPGLPGGAGPEDLARELAVQLSLPVADCATWDLFEALLEPGRMLALLTWAAPGAGPLPPGAQGLRVLRDYGPARRQQAPAEFG